MNTDAKIKWSVDDVNHQRPSLTMMVDGRWTTAKIVECTPLGVHVVYRAAGELEKAKFSWAQVLEHLNDGGGLYP